MKTSEQKKQVANEQGITPNFKLISGYYNDMNEERFYNFYSEYTGKGVLSEAEKIIKKHKFEELHRSDLIYFLVEYAQSMAFAIWAQEISLAKLNEDGAKQKIEMVNFLSQIQTQENHFRMGGAGSKFQTWPTIMEIKFITNKGLDVTIDSYQLCFDIINSLQERYSKDREKARIALSKKANKSRLQYKRKFILGLVPFINYLKKETGRFSSSNKIYSFIEEFLCVLRLEMNLDAETIKDTLKPSKNRGKTTP